MANNGADVKPNQGVGATNTSTTTNTAENTVGTATPKQNGLAVLGKYVGVSATQTIAEYATFAILHLIDRPVPQLPASARPRWCRLRFHLPVQPAQAGGEA